MSAVKKITVHIPDELLKKAQANTNASITDTVKRGLQLLAAEKAYKKLKGLKGKAKFSIDVDSLREDRS